MGWPSPNPVWPSPNPTCLGFCAMLLTCNSVKSHVLSDTSISRDMSNVDNKNNPPKKKCNVFFAMGKAMCTITRWTRAYRDFKSKKNSDEVKRQEFVLSLLRHAHHFAMLLDFGFEYGIVPCGNHIKR